MWISKYWLPIAIWAGLIGLAAESGVLIGLAAFIFLAILMWALWASWAVRRQAVRVHAVS